MGAGAGTAVLRRFYELALADLGERSGARGARAGPLDRKEFAVPDE